MPDFQTPPAKRRFLQGLARSMSGNAGTTQAARLLEALKHGPITTNECRRFLDVFDPAARVRDLRHKLGRDAIETHWQGSVTEQGVTHKVGLYCLVVKGGPH
ncbi:helix-turn-helix domain-containing protein [Limnohabitans sp. WS1]|uniref:helix-turn-helix domain-containing protein n=1 Tax=Limnohabitans sp. WS1 TaxID=1100726 RepID=UPI001E4E71E3|nr:helix-turn-helix domain-containing protein [Limnohabitans sp. WS1]